MVTDRLPTLTLVMLYIAVSRDSLAAPAQPADLTPSWANHTDTVNDGRPPQTNYTEIINAYSGLLSNYTNPNILRLPNPFRLAWRGIKKAAELAKKAKKAISNWFYPVLSTTERPPPEEISYAVSCDHIAGKCMRAYLTGPVCARTMYQTYQTFRNYCLINYLNCLGRQDLWQLAYMGKCFNISELFIEEGYPYEDDLFLDDYYQIII